MTGVRETCLLKIMFDHNVLQISTGMRRTIFHDSNASKITRIDFKMAQKWLENQTRFASLSQMGRICFCWVWLELLQESDLAGGRATVN